MALEVTVKRNDARNGIEIYFNSKPEDSILTRLKNNFWRYNKYKKCWYNRMTTTTMNFAESLKNNVTNNSTEVIDCVEQEKVNKEVINVFGVVPGDIFYTSWGYDQTNVEFYQVIRVTAKQAIVKEIASKQVDGTEGFMCCDLLPIKDKFIEKGEEIRTGIDKYNDEVYLKNCNSHHAYKFNNKPVYCSWYA